jgi:capsular polysaccharide biosynthesis protein
MELRTLWKIFLRRWWLVAIPAAAALAYALVGYLTAPAAGGFATAIRFTAATPPGDEAGGYEDSEYYPWLTSEYVVNALTDWVRTSSFAQEVSASLAARGVDIAAGAIQPAINADNERSVMVLYLSWPDAAQLASIAEAASDVLEQRSSAFFPQFGEGGVTVVRLDEPAVGPVPPPLSVRLDPLVRLGLGIAAGIGLAALVEYLDPTVRTRAEVEAMGLAVLAEVPRGRRGPAR